MPLQNRVRPDGALLRDPARGTLMGNRGGRFHDPATRTVHARPWASRRWICCVLAFRGRHREVWGSGYTELFFCDEVTALAAGHRPCFECRRADAIAFQHFLQRGLALPAPPSAAAIDRYLHAERRGDPVWLDQKKPAQDCPDGTVVRQHDNFFAWRRGTWLPWSPAGYGAPVMITSASEMQIITPASIRAALQAGYAPRWHDSADRG